jgi:hypothetical protein
MFTPTYQRVARHTLLYVISGPGPMILRRTVVVMDHRVRPGDDVGVVWPDQILSRDA